MLKHTKNSRKSIKVAAALEARLQTLEHLNSEEAATMLSRMAPQQASQMVPWSNLFLKPFDVDVLEDGNYGIAKCDGEPGAPTFSFCNIFFN